MIRRRDLDERVGAWKLRHEIVEKDYVLGWVLAGLSREPRLSTEWIFKGGTCLKKCFLETFRFSEDLDFTVLPGGPLTADEVLPRLTAVLQDVRDESGIDVLARAPVLAPRPDGRSTEGAIYYRGPLGTPEVARLRLDLTSAERIVCPVVRRPVSHPYPDAWGPDTTVSCYALPEAVAEKVRALGERCRPRDLYDVVTLARRAELRPLGGTIGEVLAEKCGGQRRAVPSLASVATTERRADMELDWQAMLAHQLPVLPSGAAYWDALPDVFEWLAGRGAPALPSVPRGAQDDPDWLPPASMVTWPQGAPIEGLRFAAIHHIVLELASERGTRRVEPYALRRSRQGELVLHAAPVGRGEPQELPLADVSGWALTRESFVPRWRIEVTPPLEAAAVRGG